MKADGIEKARESDDIFARESQYTEVANGDHVARVRPGADNFVYTEGDEVGLRYDDFEGFRLRDSRYLSRTEPMKAEKPLYKRWA